MYGSNFIHNIILAIIMHTWLSFIYVCGGLYTHVPVWKCVRLCTLGDEINLIHEAKQMNFETLFP